VIRKIKVWDIPTRLFHWALVILFAMSSYSAFESKFGFYGDMHLYSGVAIIALLIWRIIWGLVGSETARFQTFEKGPKAAIDYLKGDYTAKVAGHNPVGGYSTILMIVLILTQAILGLFSNDGMLFSGPFSLDAGEYSDVITDIHEILGLALLYIIGFHVFSIFVYLFVKKKNLVWPMIIGRAAYSDDVKAPYMQRMIWAFIIALLVGSMVYWYILG
jgi:cytochrome b